MYVGVWECTSTMYFTEQLTESYRRNTVVGFGCAPYTTTWAMRECISTGSSTYRSREHAKSDGRQSMGTETNSYGFSVKIFCEIPIKLPSLNDYVNVCRTNPYKASKFKKDLERDIGLYVSKLPVFEKPIKIHFHWVEDNKRRDLDNIAYAKKHILDAMVKQGKLKDDNRKCVTAFTDTFSYAKEAKVILEIDEV